LNEEIRSQLHEAADAHQPDRGRILARVQRGMASADVRHHRPGIARPWPKVALAGLAAASVLASAGIAVASIIQTAPAHPDTATTPAVPAPSGTASSTPSPRTSDSSVPPPTPSQPPRTTTSRPTSATSSASGTGSAPPDGNHTSDGPLSSKGSIDPHSHIYWTQSTLTLNTTQPLTTLTVELRIAQTGGVQTGGHWQTGPSDDFTTTVQETGGALVYRWDLKPGRTVPAAQHTFAAQYNHGGGARDTHTDNYRAQATAADGAHAVRGGFTPAS
jgi:hypothetical protein